MTPKTILAVVGILCAVASFVLASCSTTAWQTQIAPGGLANQAVTAVAQHYGGSAAGELASAGLSALGSVLQGYIDKEPPIDVVTKSPGVKGVGTVAVNWLVGKGVVKQKTIDNIHKAAELAATITK